MSPESCRMEFLESLANFCYKKVFPKMWNILNAVPQNVSFLDKILSV